MQRRRHRGAARGASVAAAALAVASIAFAVSGPARAAGAAGAATGGGAQITLPNEGRTIFLSTPEVAGPADVRQEQCRTSISSINFLSYSGTSGDALAALLGIDDGNIASVTVSAGGRSDTLGDGESRPGAFHADADCDTAVFQAVATGDSAAGSDLRFFRPLRTPDDHTAEVTPSSHAALDVSIATKVRLVDITVTAAGTATPGTAIPLSAAVDDPSAGTPTSITWSFGDGTSATGASTTHAWAAGTYDARAVARFADGRTGLGVARVVVGASTDTSATPATPVAGEDGDGGTSGAGTGGSGAPTTGPAASGGTVSRAPAGKPSSGTSAAGTTRRPSDSDSSAGRTPRRSTAARKPRTGTTTTATLTPVPDAVTTPVPAATPAAGAPTSAAKSPARGRASGTSPTGDRVSGVLVSARTAAAVVAPSERSQGTAPAARRGASPHGLAGSRWWLGVLGVAALLGLGAARELRPLRRSRPTPGSSIA